MTDAPQKPEDVKKPEQSRPNMIDRSNAIDKALLGSIPRETFLDRWLRGEKNK